MVRKYSGNYDGLIWVKEEVSQALETSLQSIKTFIESSNDKSPISNAIEQMQQVSGVVNMLGLQGALLLTQEILSSLNTLKQTESTNNSNLSDNVLKALLVLNNYLGLLNSEFTDHPIKLLETINELRLARAQNVLTASELIDLDLSIELTPETIAPSHLQVIKGLTLDKANNAFQILFLRWLKSDDLESLKKLARVIQYLHQTSQQHQSILLWVLAETVIDSLINARLLISNPIKLTLSKLNKPIKIFTKEGEQKLITHYPEPLIRELILLIAKSSGTDQRSTELKRLFDAEFYNQKQYQRIYSFDGKALSEATEAIIEQLQETKLHIDQLSPDSNNSESAIETIANQFETISNTLELLSESDVSQLIKQQIERIHQLADPGCPHEEQILSIANALLSAENQLQSGNSNENDPSSNLQITVIKECLDELVSIKETLVQVSEKNQTSKDLIETARQLELISGSMMMLNLNQATTLLENTAHSITNEQLTNTAENLSLFADVLTAIEVYLEGMMEHGQGRETLLNKAQKQLELINSNSSSEQLAELSSLLEADDEDTSSNNTPNNELKLANEEPIEINEPLEIATASLKLEPLELEKPSTLANTSADTSIVSSQNPLDIEDSEETTVELTLEPISLSPTTEKTSSVQQYIDRINSILPTTTNELITEPSELSIINFENNQQITSVQRYIDKLDNTPAVTLELITEPKSSENDQQVSSVQRYINNIENNQFSNNIQTYESLPIDNKQTHFAEGIDHEIAEVFLEEAEDVLLELSTLIPSWFNTAERETLSTIRRHYHTLKGSGRMAGALVIGELAWSIESTLNRLLEQQSFAASTDLKTLLNESHQLIRKLVTKFSQGEMETPAEVKQLIAHAEKINKPVIALSEENELQQIFNTEAQQHIKTLNQALDDKQERLNISKEMIRAAHSLKGCANIANALAVGSIATELESTLATLYESDIQLNPEQQSLLSQTMVGIVQLIANHNDSSVFEPDLRQLSNHLAAITPSENLEKNIDPEFLAVLLEETDELLEQYSQHIAQLKIAPSNITYQNDIKHTLNLLKQSAIDAKLDRLGEVYDLIEQALLFSLNSTQEIDFNLFDLGYEEVMIQVEAIMQSQAAPDINVFKETITTAIKTTEIEETAEAAHLTLSQENAHKSEVDPDLLAAFTEECAELLESSGQAIKQWALDPNDQNASMQLQRDLHTIKGGARLTEIIPIAELAHQTESLVLYAIEQNQTSTPLFLNLLQRCQDNLADMLDGLIQHHPFSLTADLMADIDSYFNQDSDDLLLNTQSPSDEPAIDIPFNPSPAVPTETPKNEVDNPPVAGHAEHVRVRADLLDYLTNFAGEVNISRDRVSQQNMAMQQQLGEMEATIERLQDQLRKLEIETETQILFRYEHESADKRSDFDPLELDRFSMIQQLSRGLTESVSDLNDINGSLTNLVRDSDTILLQQHRLSTGIHQSLMNTRLLPFKDLVSRLERIVRQTNQSTNKTCELVVSGAEHELDRSVIDKLVAPIEHILRNAIAHGIETPEQRLAAGKNPSGQLRLSISRDGSEILVSLSDDGQGINIDKIREKALNENLIDSNNIPDDESLIQLILTSGFSTADDISHLSGRGVGMDVVNNEIRALKGRLSIKSQKGLAQHLIFVYR